jgi:hypothetical protein
MYIFMRNVNCENGKGLYLKNKSWDRFGNGNVEKEKTKGLRGAARRTVTISNDPYYSKGLRGAQRRTARPRPRLWKGSEWKILFSLKLNSVGDKWSMIKNGVFKL